LGAEDVVDWRYFETTMQAVEQLRNNDYALWGVEQTQKSVSLDTFTVLPNVRYALLFGNEVRGIDQDVLHRCEGCIEIPQFGTKHSFNVSVSVGIVLWEYYKQMVYQKT
jgi:tRNA G18 (ribose-2'-O)-methylase SpoU